MMWQDDRHGDADEPRAEFDGIVHDIVLRLSLSRMPLPLCCCGCRCPLAATVETRRGEATQARSSLEEDERKREGEKDERASAWHVRDEREAPRAEA